MFDSLTPAELVQAMSNTLRAAGVPAGGPDASEQSEFDQVQFLSGSSIGRYLSRELRHGPTLAAWFIEDIQRVLAEAPSRSDAHVSELCRHAAHAIGADPHVDHVGQELADLLHSLARSEQLGDYSSKHVEAVIQHSLRELADRHVLMLLGEDPLSEHSQP